MNPTHPSETVRERLYRLALEKGLRQSTTLSYERLIGRLDVLDDAITDVTQEDVVSRLWTLDNVNTRLATVIALRSVFGWAIKIPKGVPKRYDLPDEDSLRLALMLSPHEVRGLLMMYAGLRIGEAGLRIGEACAVTVSSVAGDRLTVDKQVVQLHQTVKPTVVRLGPVKTNEAAIVIPALAQRPANCTDGYDPS